LLKEQVNRADSIDKLNFSSCYSITSIYFPGMAGFHVTPFFRSPFTDLGGALVNAQHYDKCGELEMRMMECLEAHGAVKGKKVCADVIDDFHECFSLRKQQLRSMVSRGNQ
jgi:NADH dehydrogenase (ubiquinone) Fe-S protein 5